MERRKIIRAALVSLALIVCFAAFAAIFFSIRNRGAPTMKVSRGDLVESIYGLGTVTANRSFQIKIGVTTAVKAVYVREGDSVTKGARLIRLEEGEIFRAPFSGTITSLPYKVMETVYPQMPILTLVNLSDRYVLVSLEQEAALQVRVGQTARMSFETLRGRTFVGMVRTLYPDGGQFFVQIDVPDLPPEVLPGMTGDVAIEVARKHDVALVPIRAIESSHVLAKTKKGRPRRVPVTIGAVDGRMGELVSGDLQPGDELVLPKK